MNWRALALLVIAANCIYWAWNTWIVAPSQRLSDHRFNADTPELVIVPERRTAPNLAAVTQLSTAQSVQTEESGANSAVIPVVQACHRVGYFIDQAEADAAIAWLETENIRASASSAQQNVFAGYWVHLPAYPNQAAAAQVVTALKEKGVKDLFVEVRAPNTNAISLGLFRQRNGAEQRLKQIQAMGFPAKISNREREQAVYWLEFEQASDKQVPLARIPVAEGQVRRLERQDCVSS